MSLAFVDDANRIQFTSFPVGNKVPLTHWDGPYAEPKFVDDPPAPIGESRAEPDSNCVTGAVRSADANNLRFDLIHPIALMAIARTYAEGAIKYGDCNWERGFPAHDLLNHALRHIYLYLAGDRSEPHLPHAAWGLCASIVSDVLWPELNKDTLRGPGCTVTPEMLKKQQDGDAERKAKRAAGEFDHLGDWSMADVAEVARILEQRRGVVAA